MDGISWCLVVYSMRIRMRTFTAIRTFATSASQKKWLDAVTKFVATKGGRVHHSEIGKLTPKPPNKGWIKILQEHPDRFRVEPRSNDHSHGFNVTVVGQNAVGKNAIGDDTAPPTNAVQKLESQWIDGHAELDAFVNMIQKDGSLTSEKRYMGLDVRLHHGVFQSIDAFIPDGHFTFDCATIPHTSLLAALERIMESDNVIALIHDITATRSVWTDKLINMQKFIDTQFLGELAFGEPFLTQEQMRKRFQRRYAGEGMVQQHEHGNEGRLFFRIVQEEIQRSLDAKEVEWLLEASERRLKSRESNQICFDPATHYAMHSASLFRTTRKATTEVYYGIPLVEKNDIGTALNVLPEWLKSTLDSHSLDKITEIVLDIGRQPQYWPGTNDSFSTMTNHCLYRNRTLTTSWII